MYPCFFNFSVLFTSWKLQTSWRRPWHFRRFSLLPTPSFIYHSSSALVVVSTTTWSLLEVSKISHQRSPTQLFLQCTPTRCLPHSMLLWYWAMEDRRARRHSESRCEICPRSVREISFIILSCLLVFYITNVLSVELYLSKLVSWVWLKTSGLIRISPLESVLLVKQDLWGGKPTRVIYCELVKCKLEDQP